MTQKQQKYYDQVVELHQKTGMTAVRIAKLGLFPVDRVTIARWIAKFASDPSNRDPQAMVKSIKSKADELDALKAKVADLEEQLRVEKLRNRLNEKIIDIAEERWHIEIRKKAGTKQ